MDYLEVYIKLMFASIVKKCQMTSSLSKIFVTKHSISNHTEKWIYFEKN